MSRWLLSLVGRSALLDPLGLDTAGWISFEHVLMMLGGGFSVGFIVTRLKRVERELKSLKNLLGQRGPDG